VTVIARRIGRIGGLRTESRSLSVEDLGSTDEMDDNDVSQTPELQARALIDKLDLRPHPEGGSYREIYRSSERVQTARGTRCAITAISMRDGEERVAVIRKGIWQAARSLGDFSLVGCNVGPGFDFEDFRLVTNLSGHQVHFEGKLAPFASLL
jgi:uncharacterized protein